jgi:ankyrin repeat protein
MTGFTSAADNDEELTKREDDAIADGDNDPDYVDGDEEEIVVIGMALINAILEYAPKEYIQKLLDEDAPLWYQDEEDGWSALHAAASVEDTELVKKLLQHGAVWNSGETRFLYFSHSARESLKEPQWIMQETLQVTSRFLSMTRGAIAPSAMQASAQVCARWFRYRASQR